MSYSFSANSIKHDNAKDLLEQAFVSSKSAENNPPCVDVVPKVIATVESLLKSDVFGTSDKVFNVSISGHANPNHEPNPGWSKDFVYITISQV